ncbi:hypothetical protein JCM24511_05210 [Saitozyma sp. JCM 24511]|nr:hypothetical protein JCM24511_05210 [Saitozyma sp. JCM 24511]
MPPKGKKTKAEEALDFLSNLDNLDAPPAPGESAPSGGAAAPPRSSTTTEPRASTDSSRKLEASVELPKQGETAASAGAGAGTGGDGTVSGGGGATAPAGGEDDEAAKALAFLEEQIKTKRAPLSVPSSVPRSASPAAGPGANVGLNAPLTGGSGSGSGSSLEPPNVTSAGSNTSPQTPMTGWLSPSSFWSTASSAIQSAQKLADEGYKKVRAEGVQGVTTGLEGLGVKGMGMGVDLGSLRKGAEERLAGIAKGVDLEKLRHDLVSTTTSTLTTILNTVAPPISAHETLELWLSHPMVGYQGVESVVYRAWTRVLEQTESGELVVVWSAPPQVTETKRGMYPVQGWEIGWEAAGKEMEAIKAREEKDPQGRGKEPNPNVPVTTVPIFLHLQPLLAPLSIPEPPILLLTDPAASSATTSTSSSSKEPAKHLHFIISLHDPAHSLRFTTTTQPVPGDWLEVEYEQSDWVEERLVDVLKTGIEVIAQDYVATRMGLKASNASRSATPGPNKGDASSAAPDAENAAAAED